MEPPQHKIQGTDEQCSHYQNLLSEQLGTPGALKGLFVYYFHVNQHFVLSNFVLTAYHCTEEQAMPPIPTASDPKVQMHKILVFLSQKYMVWRKDFINVNSNTLIEMY